MIPLARISHLFAEMTLYKSFVPGVFMKQQRRPYKDVEVRSSLWLGAEVGSRYAAGPDEV
jgi:hypothetical protein